MNQLKTLLAVSTLFVWSTCFAATDVNQATEAELDSIKGIGPALSSRIMQERQKAPFTNWDDLINRVNGIGITNARELSDAGLTVKGASYSQPTTARK